MFYTNVQEQTEALIASQPEGKRADMQALHLRILEALPGCKLWFDEGRDSEHKTVANPVIGYGFQVLKYAGGKTREFFQIGLSTNKTGISIYILGLKDKAYLAQTYGEQLGKASVTGYCIKFKALKDINVDTLIAAIQYGAEATAEKSS